MSSRLSALSIALVLLLAFVSLAAAKRLVKESSRLPPHLSAPHGWVRGGRVERHQPIQMHIFVKQQNLPELERYLYAVSDPRSPFYGQHLSFEEVNELVAPSKHSVAAVTAWLEAHGVNKKDIKGTPNGDILRVETPAHQVEALLDAEFFHFTHSSSGHQVIRTPHAYTLPEEVSPHIDFVGPTIRFPHNPAPKGVQALKQKKQLSKAARAVAAAARHQLQKRFGAKVPLDGVTPALIRQLYSIGDYKGSNANNSVAIASFLEQYMDNADLATFFSQFATGSLGQAPKIIGPNDQSQPGIEAMLDIEYIMGVATNVRTEFWYTAGRAPKNPENEPFLVWLETLANTSSVPLVHSISYGDNEDSVDQPYALRVSTEFQKAGVRGLSLLSASGDGGVGGSQPSACTNFIPTFPAVSPFITAVGGSTGSSLPETAASLSGGGFSNYFAPPAYQTASISQYFSVAQNLPSASVYNATGAGFPDVAAQAEGFNIVIYGSATSVDGTSCATPTFSAVVGLLNDIRLNAGKSPLGFLNPLFYQHPEAFNDITSGSNPGCNTNGFEAAPGWDPVTGLGSPRFDKLADIIKTLP